jgi:hypothetical protein
MFKQKMHVLRVVRMIYALTKLKEMVPWSTRSIKDLAQRLENLTKQSLKK